MIATAFAIAAFAFACPAAASASSSARAIDNVRLRAEPSVGSTALAIVVEGSDVGILGVSGDWIKVEHEGIVGYVRSDYLVRLLGGPGAAGGSLKPGGEGDAVKDLQASLAACGVYDGPANGKFGPLTEAAVKKFQEANGLEPDGIVGAATQRKLNDKAVQAATDALCGADGGGSGTGSGGGGSAGSQIPGTYRRDDEGPGVVDIQKALAGKGCYDGPANGKFGPLTEEAVIKFQEANKLEADGIVGKETLAALGLPTSAAKGSQGAAQGAAQGGSGASAGSAAQNAQGESDPRATRDAIAESKSKKPDARSVELLDWSVAKNYMTIGVTAAIYDVRTGITYNVRSFSNGLHADVEPVTRSDTALLKQTYGGVWSWDPRPVWVSINGHVMAASINGMPHGGGVNGSNGMDGQICLHFRGGSTHNGNKNYARLHQEAVAEAWAAARKR